ncbi:MAG: hypothetical protein IJV21_01995 [Lachnospiraceae bacterium]|nr:hypothetical protein [Lachnospiraceae bacterium]MBR1669530.1 hypothetical protein [Butyrivibrio sp.]
MIYFFILIFHILIVMLVYVLTGLGYLKIDEPMFILVGLIPLWGVICAFLITFLINRGKTGVKNEDLESLKGNIQGSSELPIQAAESDNIVPLEDALIMNEASVRRSVMMDVLMSDAHGYMPVINQARMNDDVEVVHYATTAMVELSKEYDLKLQEYSAEYAQNPGREGLLDEYTDFLEQYISSGMIQGQLLEIQRSTYEQMLIEKVTKNPNIDDYERLVKSFFASGQLTRADAALSAMEARWPDDERNWPLRFRYYVESGAGDKAKEMIRSKKRSGEYISRSMRQIMDFWEPESGEAPA